MRSYFLKSLGNEMEYWWISLLSGLIGITLGIICVIMPKITLITLSYLLIGASIMNGILKIIFALSYRYKINDWGFTLTIGIAEILIGIILIILPSNIIIAFLIYLIGVGMLLHSIKTIIESVNLHRLKIKNNTWLIFIAILSLLFSLFFLFSPIIFKRFFVVILTAILFIIYGIAKISLAFSMRSIYKKSKQHSDNNKWKDELLYR